MAKLTLNNITTGFASNTAVNANNDLVEAAMENTLSRDGTSPNAMSADIDMNSNQLINVGAPSNPTDAARLVDISDSDATGAASATLRTDLASTTSATKGSFLVGVFLSVTGWVGRTLSAWITDRPYNPKDFGLVAGTGQSSTVRIANSAAIQAALDTGSNVMIPPAVYECDGNITQNIDYQAVFAYGAILHFYHNDDHGWTMGENGAANYLFQARCFGLRCEYRGTGYVSGTVPDGTAANSLYSGFAALQNYECEADVSANYFLNNFLLNADDTACYYNKYTINKCEYGRKGVYVYASGSGSGLISTNTFFVYRMQQCTKGIVIEGDVPATNKPGDTVFNRASIEHGTGTGEHAVYDDGASTVFRDLRMDGNWSVADYEFGANSIRCHLESHLFTVSPGNVVNNGSNNTMDIMGQRVLNSNVQDITAFISEREERALQASLISATYKWTASGSGTSEYYCELAAGGDPSLSDPIRLMESFDKNLMAKGTLGSLAAGAWAYGDNDTLGYSTVYVRLSDSTDPDTQTAGYVGVAPKPHAVWKDEKTGVGSSPLFLEGVSIDVDENDYFHRGYFGLDTANQSLRWEVRGDGNIHSERAFSLKDGVTAPTSETGRAQIFIDTADGDLKIIYADGVTKTIVVDT